MKIIKFILIFLMLYSGVMIFLAGGCIGGISIIICSMVALVLIASALNWFKKLIKRNKTLE